MNIQNQQKNNIAYFMLPGFCEHYMIYQAINNFLLKHPEAQRENAKVYCYYGNIPFCTWDGGRVFDYYHPLSIEKIKDMQNYYNNVIDTKIRLVYTNNLIEEQHCHERYNNISLQIFNNNNNEIVINSSILEEYIKANYPNYNLISSTTKCLSIPELSKQELNNDNYKFICLDYNLNHNWTFLDSLTDLEKQKTEFLVNPICHSGCTHRKEHYKLNSLFSLSYGKRYQLKHCNIDKGYLYPYKDIGVITPDEIYNEYLLKGFQYFKIEGRTHNDAQIAIYYADYLIKPEYQKYFLASIL